MLYNKALAGRGNLVSGLKKVTINNEDKSKAGQKALAEAEGAISIAPNNAIVVKPNIRFPIPFGLWIYNRFERYEKGFGKWIFKKLAAKPVYVSTVNPGNPNKSSVQSAARLRVFRRKSNLPGRQYP